MRNIAGHLKDASDFIQRRAVRNFSQVDRDYGGRIAKLLERYHVREVVASVKCYAVLISSGLAGKARVFVWLACMQYFSL